MSVVAVKLMKPAYRKRWRLHERGSATLLQRWVRRRLYIKSFKFLGHSKARIIQGAVRRYFRLLRVRLVFIPIHKRIRWKRFLEWTKENYYKLYLPASKIQAGARGYFSRAESRMRRKKKEARRRWRLEMKKKALAKYVLLHKTRKCFMGFAGRCSGMLWKVLRTACAR